MAFQGLIGFVGLDQLSLELAALLLRSGYQVQAFERSNLKSHSQQQIYKAITSTRSKTSVLQIPQVSVPLMDEFVRLGGSECASPMEAGKDVTALVAYMPDMVQINDELFGHDGALKGSSKDMVVILHSTMLPSYIQTVEKRIVEESKRRFVVDMYVSRGILDNGQLMITSSGNSDAIARARPVLSAMSGKLYIFEGEVGAGSKSKMVSELLEGIHLVSMVEAISFGAQMGIHPWMLYDIISSASGNTWVFENYLPEFLKGIGTRDLLDSYIKKLGIVMDMAKSLVFPLPLLGVAYQQLLQWSLHMEGKSGETPLVEVWEGLYGVNITGAASAETHSPEQLGKEVIAHAKPANRIGFIGLGAMGFGMATQLIKSNFSVIGFDVYKPTLARFAEEGGLIGSSPAEVSKDVDVLVIMVTNEAQVECVLYGECGAVSALPYGASIVLSSTVSPAFVSQLEKRLQNEGRNLKLVDAPVSGGVKGAYSGSLTVMASGTDEALKSVGLVLSALSQKLYVIQGSCGGGSAVKMVNQLLAGVHLVASAEAMAFGACLGLDTRILFDFVLNSKGASWMFRNRVPHMLDNDYTPRSALDILVKDLGVVAHECSSLQVPLHLLTVAHQLFLSGSAAGWGRQDDAGIVKFYETLGAVKVERKERNYASVYTAQVAS